MTIFKELVVLIITIPTTIGLIRYKNIETSFHFIIYCLLAGSLTEISLIEFKSSIASQIYSIAETQLMLALLFAWDKNEFIFKEKAITHIAFLILSFVDAHCILNHIYESKWIYLLLLATLSFYAMVILYQQLDKEATSKITNSKLFILIPFVVFNIYFIILKILMGILYTKARQKLFIDLYEVIIFLNAVSYISYSYALIKAPDKDSFLPHKMPAK